MKKALLTVFALGCTTIAAQAEIKMSRIFCDQMVLQQNQKNTIWGWTDAGKNVSVKANWGAEESVKANADGYWKVHLDTPSYGTDKSFSISDGSDTVKINDVAIGEVWLCFGQSNMGWAMGQSFEAEKEADVNLPNFRIFQSAVEHASKPMKIRNDRLSAWKPCDPKTAAETSAVSYYFGKSFTQNSMSPSALWFKPTLERPSKHGCPWKPKKMILALNST